MKLLTHIPAFLKNKFFLAGSFFLVWMFFFESKDVFYNIDITRKYNELQKSDKHWGQQIAETRKELDLLRTNSQTIEKYARENYLMKKDNEDLFIINTPSDRK